MNLDFDHIADSCIDLHCEFLKFACKHPWYRIR